MIPFDPPDPSQLQGLLIALRAALLAVAVLVLLAVAAYGAMVAEQWQGRIHPAARGHGRGSRWRTGRPVVR